MKLSAELRTKKSRDNRDLLDRAADRIDVLEAEVEAFKELIVNIAESEIRVMLQLVEAIGEKEDKT